MGPKVVYADPRGRVPYYTYVLLGLARVGWRVRFRRLDCPVTHGMPVLLGGRRVWIDTDDSSRVPPEITNWAEVIAKVNVAPGDTNPALVPLGPLFGIRIWPLPWGYTAAVRMSLGGANPVRALRHVRYQGIARVGIDAYIPAASDPTYLYGRTQRWSVRGDQANRARQHFVDAVRDLPLDVDVTMIEPDRSARVDLPTYLKNTSRSAVVFNTPAMHECLGWKLGEYLALGKAIVTTPLERVLPAPIVHGEHAHYVIDDVDAIRSAVCEIIENHEYRRHLEVNARRWFDEHIAPPRVGARIVGAALGEERRDPQS